MQLMLIDPYFTLAAIAASFLAGVLVGMAR